MQRHKKDPPKKLVPMPISRVQIFDLAENQDDLIKSAIYCLYLSGARISELLLIQPKHFENVTDPNGNKQIKLHLTTLKKKKGFPFREIPMRTSSEIENKMLRHIMRHKATCEQLGIKRLFTFNRSTLWRKLSKLTFETTLVDVGKGKLYEKQTQHLYPHYLRHCRATHLASDYIRNPAILQYLFGWNNIEMASTYINLDWREASQLLLSSQSAPKNSLADLD